MSLAYYPFYADRYEADTAHLSMLEDGAYNRLLRLCWRSPGCKLPHDLPWIFRQLRAHSPEDQAAVQAVLDEFFTKGRGKIWSKKLLEVHVQVSVAHQNKSEAGKKGAAAKALKTNKSGSSTAKAELKQPLSNKEPEPEPKREEEDGGGGSAGAREASPPEGQTDQTDRERILAAIGVGPDGIAGPSKFLGGQADVAELRRWLELPGVTADAACVEIVRIMAGKADGPPSSFKYFTPAMQRLSGALSAPKLQPADAPQARGSPHPPALTAADLAEMVRNRKAQMEAERAQRAD